MKTITVAVPDETLDALEAGALLLGAPDAAYLLAEQAARYAPHYAAQARAALREAGRPDDGPLASAVAALKVAPGEYLDADGQETREELQDPAGTARAPARPASPTRRAGG